MDEYLDPEFKAHQAIARSFAEMMRMIGDVHLLPLDVREYAQSVEGRWNALANSKWYQQIVDEGISFSKWTWTLTTLSRATFNGIFYFEDMLKMQNKMS